MAAGVGMDDKVLIKFAQKLAGNEKKFRDRALKKLRKWLSTRMNTPKGAFTQDDFMKIWKGLHYSMWMSDKPLIQEELARSLSQLIHVFKDVHLGLLFFDCFLKTQAREWSGIDRLRLDKFMMLIRLSLHQCFVMLQQYGWQTEHVEELKGILVAGVVSGDAFDVPDGLKSHIADIFMEELEKVGAEQLTAENVHIFLDAYAAFLYQVKNKSLCRHVIRKVFFHLIGDAVDKMEREAESDESDEDDGEEKTVLKVDTESLADLLFEYASREDCVAKNRRDIYALVKSFQNLTEGILPAEEDISSASEDEDEEAAVRRLQKFEKSLSCDTRRKKMEAKKKRKNAKRKAEQLEEEIEETPKKKKKKVTEEISNGMDIPGKKTKNKFLKDGKKKKKKAKAEVEHIDSDEDTVSKPAGEELLFQGGFVDSDEEVSANTIAAGGKSKKKDKVKKKKKAKDSDTSGDLNDDEMATNEGVVPNGDSETHVKKKKNKKSKKDKVAASDSGIPDTCVQKENKRRSLDSALDTSDCTNTSKKSKKRRQTLDNGELNSIDSDLDQDTSSSFVQIKSKGEDTNSTKKKSKNKKNKLNARVSNDTPEEGEIEIVIPNKKYKGPLKEQFAQIAKASMDETESKSQSSFASFEKVKTPPAFVKKALLKATPKTDPKKKKVKRLEAPASDPGRKRVSFVMAKNTAQVLSPEYSGKPKSISYLLVPCRHSSPGHQQDSLTVSPVVPFNPKTLPETGILKPSPHHTPKKTLFKGRSRASDFF